VAARYAWALERHLALLLHHHRDGRIIWTGKVGLGSVRLYQEEGTNVWLMPRLHRSQHVPTEKP